MTDITAIFSVLAESFKNEKFTTIINNPNVSSDDKLSCRALNAKTRYNSYAPPYDIETHNWIRFDKEHLDGPFGFGFMEIHKEPGEGHKTYIMSEEVSFSK
jgi:hypothetical protein